MFTEWQYWPSEGSKPMTGVHPGSEISTMHSANAPLGCQNASSFPMNAGKTESISAFSSPSWEKASNYVSLIVLIYGVAWTLLMTLIPAVIVLPVRDCSRPCKHGHMFSVSSPCQPALDQLLALYIHTQWPDGHREKTSTDN